jgi:choline dehydrogenase
MASKPISDFVDEERSPGPQVSTRYELKAFLREKVRSYLHMTSSAPMGPDHDARAVVDENGKVRRIDGLYVGDASIMPDIPSVAINPTVIMLAEVIADRIKAAEQRR